MGRHPEWVTPCCGVVVDSGTSLQELKWGMGEVEWGEAVPKGGDIGVCLNCGAVLYYLDGSGRMRLASGSEVAGLDSEGLRDLWKARRYIAEKGEHRKGRGGGYGSGKKEAGF
jgi:hypothetical protein